MFCPSCGKTNSADQRFCRSCGLGLEKIVQSIAEQLPEITSDLQIEKRRLTVERWLNIVGVGAASLVALSVLWGIIYTFIIVKGAFVVGSILLTFIVGLIVFGLLAIYRDHLIKASNRQQMAQREIARAQNTDTLLNEPNHESVASVTEHTTELISIEEPERRDGLRESN